MQARSAPYSPKIDSHTHIVDSETRDEYFSRTDGYAIVMQMPETILPNPDTEATVRSDSRLFLCPAIDLRKDVKKQLDKIDKKLDENKVVGLKIYLTYQAGRASDEFLYPAYEYASKKGLTVTFHTGLCGLLLPSDNDMPGSNAKYVEIAARLFPDVNFVIAHMDDPRFDQCIDIVMRNKNLYTDFSGAYETGTKEGNDVDGAIETFARAIRRHPGTEKRILYGTDFCPRINLGQLDEYDYSIEKIFAPKDHPDVYYNNCLRAFPALKKFIDKK